MHRFKRHIQLVLLSVSISQAWAAAEAIEVAIKNNEVWLNKAGRSIQLTHDGRSKAQAELSTHHDRIAYYNECPQGEGCTPSVVILDLEGKRIRSFTPTMMGF